MLNMEMARFRVADIMSRDFLKLDAGLHIEDAYHLMHSQNCKDAAVSKTFEDGEKHLGLLTLREVARWMLETDSTSSTVEQVVRPCDGVLLADDSMDRARQLLSEHRVGRLPVFWEGRVVGILHSAELRDSCFNKLAALNGKYREVIHQMSEGVTITDPDGYVVLWSRKCEERYGIKESEMLNRKLEQFFPTALTLQVLKTKESIENVCHSPKPDHYCMISAHPIHLDGEFIGVVATEKDVTDFMNVSLMLQNANLEIDYLKRMASKSELEASPEAGILGANPRMQQVIEVAKRVAATRASIVIIGESGTGKEVIAERIHRTSGRKGQFVAVNCSAIPGALLESEFFGYVGGAFTGALQGGKSGYFQAADQGTLFLDEIGDLPMESQAKLLRVLQEGKIMPVGGSKAIAVDVRIISATHKDLKAMIATGAFREDLYYRLNVVELQLPPLRERKEDIIPLFNHFVKECSRRYGIAIDTVSRELLTVLINYGWKGNIRELKNTAEHMVVLAKSRELDIGSLPQYILEQAEMPMFARETRGLGMEEAVQVFEMELIQSAMDRAGGNKAEAAKLLEIKRSTLYYKLKLYNMES